MKKSSSTKPAQGGGTGTWSGKENFQSWDEGRNALSQFLEDLKRLLDTLVEKRIPSDSRQLFLDCLGDVKTAIDNAKNQLALVKTESGGAYNALHKAGLTGRSLRLKLREFYRSIKTAPVEAVLKMADVILGSLPDLFFPLELVREFKDTLEARLKHGGDDEIIALNLGGTVKWWE
jgi:hypothetical protein